MQDVLIPFVIIALSVLLYPVALGFDRQGRNAGSFVQVFIPPVVVTLMFLIGQTLGNLFMHTMESMRSVVIFVVFALIGIRLLMEVFQVRRGARTYALVTPAMVVLGAVAQGINTFLIGLIFVYYQAWIRDASIILLVSSTFVCLMGWFLPLNKIQLTISALLFLISAVTILTSGILLAFF